MTKKTLRLIMGALRLNVTIEDAAAFAKVSARTLYRHIEENEDFCQEYEQARVQGKIHSLSLITASRSTRDHQWLLEKQHRKEYGKQVVDVNIGGQPENPVVFDFTGMSVDDVLEVIKATEPDQSEENK